MAIENILKQGPISFSQALRHPVTVKRALKVGMVVGTILIAINQGDVLLNGGFPPLWKIILTYMVPYSVSSYSSAMFITELSRSMENPAP